MGLSRKTTTFICSTSFLLAYIIADCFFRDSAFKSSNSFTVKLQSHLSSGFFEVFFIIFCDILYPIIAAALLILYYALTFQKVKTLAFVLYFITITYICSILKIFYNDPRPYWVDNEVEAKECYSEYGNPSGHSMMSILLFGMIWMRYVWALAKYGEVKFLNDYFGKKSKKDDENNIPLMIPPESNGYETVEVFEDGLEIKGSGEKENQKNAKKNENNRTMSFFMFSCCLILVEFFILFGRIYLGMHSYNEVLLGFFYGLYFLIVYYLYIETILMKMIESIILRNYRHQLKGNYTDWKVLSAILLSFLICMILPIAVFEIYKKVLTFPVSWVERINYFCSSNTTLKMFLNKCFVDCGVIGTVFGILLGIFFTNGEYHCLRVMYSTNANPHYVFLKQVSFKKHFLRVIIVVICAGLWAGVFALIPNQNSAYVNFFVNNLLGTFLSGFFLIKLVPLVNNKLKLEYDKDFLKYNNGDLIVHNNVSIPYEEIKN